MKNFILLGLSVLFLASLSLSSYSQGLPPVKLRIKLTNYRAQMQFLQKLDVDIAGINLKKGHVDVLVNQKQYSYIRNSRMQIQSFNKDLGMMRPDEEYKNPEEIEEILKGFAQRYPDLTQLVSIGKSIKGRNIWAIKISDNAKRHDISEPAILFNSMHHAREVMTPEISLDIVEWLLTNYGTNDKATHWVNSNQIWVVPMLNVDGNNLVWTKDSMWRKNARGGYGVDINRNYPHQWGACGGSSGWKWSQTYRGPEAASEPETQALMKLVEQVRPVFDISYHAYSELVLYPQGCKGDYSKNHEVISRIGKQLGQLLNYTPGTSWEILYAVDGSDIDWMDAEYEVIPYVLEVNSSSEGFQPDYSKWRDKTVKLNRKGWMHLLTLLDTTGVRGVVRSSLKGNFLKDYEVKISRRDRDGKYRFFKTTKAKNDGSFHAVIPNGKYKLETQLPGEGKRVRYITIGNRRVNISL